MNDMGRIDPMYQFSLDAYIELFSNSIEKSLKHPRLEERINYLNDYHTFAVYQYTCRGLFERHKLLFSFQMCAKILEAATKLNLDEYNFFLRGGIVLDREAQMDKPCPWLDDASWDNVTELDKWVWSSTYSIHVHIHNMLSTCVARPLEIEFNVIFE